MQINSYQLIAEVKTRSPFGFVSKRSWDQLFEIACKYGDMISIHTDPRWGGTMNHITKASQCTDKPILAKGIHATDKEIELAVTAGANAVLVVGRLPARPLRKYCFIEPLDLAQLREFASQVDRLVWNTRNLTDGSHKNETLSDVRKYYSGWLCQASNITKPSDVDQSVQAALIGQHLPEFIKLL